MTLPLHPGTGEVHAVVADSTTVFSMRAGPAHPSQFYPQALESNPALTDALDQGGEHVQQVEDAIAISNIAILALPMVLTLVPIAAIADVSRTRMVLYLILSDVLTTVPMGIKGVELLLIAKQEFIGTVTRMSDTAADKMENTAVSELWVAQCGIRASVKPYGIAFVTVSVVMLVLGVVSEVIARWWIGKRARRKQVVLADGGKMVDGVAGVAGVTMAYETLSRDYFDDDLVEGGIGWKGGYAADD